ncbi:MAG: YdcF family protein [Alphaproteobacteria bacterium]|nr:YdcF family protein [Alphaproteobacteria bacterium]
MTNLLKTSLCYLFFLMGAFWVIGFIIFVYSAISLKYHPLEKAEAIVTLTGGSDRIAESLNLLKDKKAPLLFISGVNENVTGYHLLKEVPKELEEKIELGYQAKTTQMNAEETAEWVKKNNINSFILVTSFYHMPRSLLEMKYMLSDLEIIPYAVFPKNFGQNTAWIHTRYAWQLFLEYHKFLIVYLLRRS